MAPKSEQLLLGVKTPGTGNIIVTVEETFQAQDSNLLINSTATASGAITLNVPKVKIFGDSDVSSLL